MTSSIFDIVDEEETLVDLPSPEPHEEKESLFKGVEEVELPKDPQKWWESIPKDVLKGFLESVQRVGRMMGPIPTGQPEEQVQREFSERLDEAIPSDKTFLGSALRRGEQIAGPAAVFPGGGLGTAGRGLAGGVAGQAAEHLGAPEWLQTIAEIAPFLAPGLGKQIQPTKKQEKAVALLRKAGATEQEIAPVIQSPKKQQIIGSVAQKGGKATTKLKETKQMLDRTVESFKTGKFGAEKFKDQNWNKMVNELQSKLQDMPAKVRNTIGEDFQQFLKGPKDVKSAIKLYRDINANYSPKTAQLGTMKDPIKDALATISPELARDFNLTNDLFVKYYSIYNKLSPKNADLFNQIINLTEWGRIGAGVYFGQYPLIVEVIGEKAGRILAREMLINPRMQNLAKQTAQALNANKYGVANQLNQKMVKMLSKEHPDAAAELQTIDFSEMENL